MALPFIDLWLCEQRRGYILTSEGVRSLNDDEEELFQPKLLWTVLACASTISMAVSGYAYGVLNSLPWCNWWSPCWSFATRARRRQAAHGQGQPQMGQQVRRRRRSSAPAASPYQSLEDNGSKWNVTGETSPQYHHVRHQIILTVMAWIACIALLTAAVIVVLQLTTYFRRRPRDRANFIRNGESEGEETITQSLSVFNVSNPNEADWRSFANSLHDLAVARLLAVKIALVVAEFCFLSYLFWRICHAISIYLLFQQKKLPFMLYILFALAIPAMLKTIDVTLLFNSYFAYRKSNRYQLSIGAAGSDFLQQQQQQQTSSCSTTPAQTLIRSIAYAVVLLLVALVEYALHMRALKSIRKMFLVVNARGGGGGGGDSSEDERFENVSSAESFHHHRSIVEFEYEKECLKGIQNKLRVIRLCFLVCWAPLAVLNIMAAMVYYLYYYTSKANVVVGDAEGHEPVWWNILLQFMVGLSYFCAVVRPFQLLFDAFAYWDSAVPPPPKTILQNYNNSTDYDACTVYSNDDNFVDSLPRSSFRRPNFQPPPVPQPAQHNPADSNKSELNDDDSVFLLRNSVRSSSNLHDDLNCALSTPQPTAPITARTFKESHSDRSASMRYYYVSQSESELIMTGVGSDAPLPTSLSAPSAETAENNVSKAVDTNEVIPNNAEKHQPLISTPIISPLAARRQKLRESFAQRLVKEHPIEEPSV